MPMGDRLASPVTKTAIRKFRMKTMQTDMQQPEKMAKGDMVEICGDRTVMHGDSIVKIVVVR